VLAGTSWVLGWGWQNACHSMRALQWCDTDATLVHQPFGPVNKVFNKSISKFTKQNKTKTKKCTLAIEQEAQLP